MAATQQTDNPPCVDSGGGPRDPALYDTEAFAEDTHTFEDVTNTRIERHQAQGYLVIHRAFAPKKSAQPASAAKART